MVAFYLWARASGMSERAIWRQGYFDPAWQTLFDAFHSLPLLALAALAAWRLRMQVAVMFLLAMMLHSLIDFGLHHDDSHRHFWPLSDWRLASPISYWDPAHFGAIVAPLELLLVAAGGAWLLRTAASTSLFRLTGAILMLYLLFWGFALLMWAA